MASAAQAQSDPALRDEEPRSAILTFLRLAEKAGDVWEKIQVATMKFKDQNIGPRAEEDSRKSWASTYLQIMYMQPDTDHDVMLLAAHAAMMAEQLDALVEDDPNDENNRLTTGITLALESIAAFVARRLAPVDFNHLPREFAAALRRYIEADKDRRSDGEGH